MITPETKWSKKPIILIKLFMKHGLFIILLFIIWTQEDCATSQIYPTISTFCLSKSSICYPYIIKNLLIICIRLPTNRNYSNGMYTLIWHWLCPMCSLLWYRVVGVKILMGSSSISSLHWSWQLLKFSLELAASQVFLELTAIILNYLHSRFQAVPL
jgi:hypothetical protein